MDTKLIVSASPHVRSEETTQSLMACLLFWGILPQAYHWRRPASH